jgi:hypothetical protein
LALQGKYLWRKAEIPTAYVAETLLTMISQLPIRKTNNEKIIEG